MVFLDSNNIRKHVQDVENILKESELVSSNTLIPRMVRSRYQPSIFGNIQTIFETSKQNITETRTIINPEPLKPKDIVYASKSKLVQFNEVMSLVTPSMNTINQGVSTAVGIKTLSN